MQITAAFVKSGPVGQHLEVARVELMSPGERLVGILRAPLFHEVEPEIHQIRRLRARQLQGAPEMPFPGGQVVHLREDVTEQIVGLGVVGIGAERRACDLLGIGDFPVGHEQLNQVVESPVGTAVNADLVS